MKAWKELLVYSTVLGVPIMYPIFILSSSEMLCSILFRQLAHLAFNWKQEYIHFLPRSW